MLTGIVAAFLAKGMEPRLAAAAAVRAHTDAVAASGRRSGLMASDLLDALPRVAGCIGRRSRSTSAPSGGTRAGCCEALDGSELWAVVKADGYGHGAVDVAGAALGEGATALCVATVAEGLELRRELPGARILVMGPSAGREIAHAREADLELTRRRRAPVPEGVRVHSSSTPAWAAGASPSCRRRPRRWSG